IVIIADPDYDTGILSGLSHGLWRLFEGEQMEQQYLPSRWRRLPGTREEAEAIAALFREHASLYLGKNATKEVLQSSECPRRLHIATHGFVIPDTEGGVGRNTALESTQRALLRS